MVQPPACFKDVLKGKLDPVTIASLRRAFDVIGSIAILEIPRGLEAYETRVGKALLLSFPNIRTVCKKEGGHTGHFRRQPLRILAGKRSKTTIHTECGLRFKVHVQDAYFSPRLSGERLRIARLVKKGERVLVMFSGVAPYPLIIASQGMAASIVGVEANPKAHGLAVENLALNKRVSAPIALYQGDVRAVVPCLSMKFDRIIMPLPRGADKFLDVAVQASKKGTVIHYYDFCPEDQIPVISEKPLAILRGLGCIARHMATVRCGQTGVRQYRVCVDMEVVCSSPTPCSKKSFNAAPGGLNDFYERFTNSKGF